MNWILDWVHNNKVAALGIAYIIGSNLIVNLPKPDEIGTVPFKKMVYEYFYKVVTGILQMVPNPKPKPIVGPVTDSSITVVGK